jgi:tagatose-6-phosphate ketose/aldose isomerase
MPTERSPRARSGCATPVWSCCRIATNDRGFAMTSSFSSMLLAAALAFGVIASGTVASLSRAGRAVMAAAHPLAQRLASQRYERVVYLGSNALRGLAAEAALKLLELTDGRTVAVSDSVLGFRHGPKTIINDRTLVVVALTNDRYARAYDRDLLAELERDGRAGTVLALTSTATTSPQASACSSMAWNTRTTRCSCCWAPCSRRSTPCDNRCCLA